MNVQFLRDEIFNTVGLQINDDQVLTYDNELCMWFIHSVSLFPEKVECYVEPMDRNQLKKGDFAFASVNNTLDEFYLPNIKLIMGESKYIFTNGNNIIETRNELMLKWNKIHFKEN